MIGPLSLLGLAAAAPYLVEAVRKPVGTRDVPGNTRFANLPQGRIAYQWHGPEGGPIAVCIHGLTSPSFTWDGLFPHLSEAGFRVLTFDLYGRGLSDRPKGVQDTTFFNNLLDALLKEQGIDEPITLIGNSMGSAICTAYAADRPERIRQVILLVPAGLGHDLGTAANMTRSLPGISHWMIHAFYPRTLRKGIEAERSAPSTVSDIGEKQLDELNYRGFLRSVHSSLCGILGTTLEDEHRTLAKAGVPVTAVWGTADDIIPIACRDTLGQWNPNAQSLTLPNGHGLVYTHTADLWVQLEPVLIR